MGQGLLVHRYTEEFARHGQVTGQVLLTVDDVTRRSHYRNAQRTFAKLLELGVVPIVNENDTVATREIRFGDNDRLAALVAHLVHADLLVLLSDVDGLYDAPPSGAGEPADPRGHATSTSSSGVQIGRAGAAGVGTGGMQTKLEAARIATGAGIPVVLTDMAHAPGGAGRAPRPARCSTPPGDAARPGCCGWRTPPSPRAGSSSTPGPCGRSPSGARRCCRPGSPACAGTFVAGDPVDLVDEAGRVVARGLVNYDAEELPGLLGRSTRELARELGAAYEREVVHRDDLSCSVTLTRHRRVWRIANCRCASRRPDRTHCASTGGRARVRPRGSTLNNARASLARDADPRRRARRAADRPRGDAAAQRGTSVPRLGHLRRATPPRSSSGTRARPCSTSPPWRCGCGTSTATRPTCRGWEVVGLEVLEKDLRDDAAVLARPTRLIDRALQARAGYAGQACQTDVRRRVRRGGHPRTCGGHRARPGHPGDQGRRAARRWPTRC